MRRTERRHSDSLVLVHERVLRHVRRKVARDALLPVRHLERRRVAPRLERELLVDHALEAARPLQARERGDRRFDEPRADEVRATAGGTLSAKRERRESATRTAQRCR